LSSCGGSVGEPGSNLRLAEQGRGNGDDEKVSSPKAGSSAGRPRWGCEPSVDSMGGCGNMLVGEAAMACGAVRCGAVR